MVSPFWAGWNSGVSSTGLIQEYALTSQPFNSYLQLAYAASCPAQMQLSIWARAQGNPFVDFWRLFSVKLPHLQDPAPTWGAELLGLFPPPRWLLLDSTFFSLYFGKHSKQGENCSAFEAHLWFLSSRIIVLYVCVQCQNCRSCTLPIFYSSLGQKGNSDTRYSDCNTEGLSLPHLCCSCSFRCLRGSSGLLSARCFHHRTRKVRVRSHPSHAQAHSEAPASPSPGLPPRAGSISAPRRHPLASWLLSASSF